MSRSSFLEATHGTLQSFRKDEKLNLLAERFNVAQFVSFAPYGAGPTQQFCRMLGVSPNERFRSVDQAVAALFERSAEGTVNIRSFSEQQSQSREFLYGIRSLDEAVAALRRIASEGAFAIVNETINVSDGGVSGVAMGGLVEFRPDETPRGVERPGFASLPLDWAMSIFSSVYGFDPELDQSLSARMEFSLHPARRGWQNKHVIFWEYGELDDFNRGPATSWPNDFSRMIGDKVYGLLVANAIGVRVPRTTVLTRRIAPFTFGTDTGSDETWIRTSPVVQVPGKFTTAKGWMDPFKLMQDEDPDGTMLASILSQQAVSSVYSGAALEQSDGVLLIEGTRGTGEGFMLGSHAPEPLPIGVVESVRGIHTKLHTALGSVRFEWVYDGQATWVVQLHTGISQSLGSTLVPGAPSYWVRFDIKQGLEALRSLVQALPQDTGIELDGAVGRSSHMADVVRKASVPTRIIEKNQTGENGA